MQGLKVHAALPLPSELVAVQQIHGMAVALYTAFASHRRFYASTQPHLALSASCPGPPPSFTCVTHD
jgi:hypothetical protein